METSKNQGEGNKKADRRYREAASEHAKTEASDKAARRAAEELDANRDDSETETADDR